MGIQSSVVRGISEGATVDENLIPAHKPDGNLTFRECPPAAMRVGCTALLRLIGNRS